MGIYAICSETFHKLSFLLIHLEEIINKKREDWRGHTIDLEAMDRLKGMGNNRGTAC